MSEADAPQEHAVDEQAVDEVGGYQTPDPIHLDLSGRESTGDAEVDAVMERWAEADGQDLQSHVETAERAQSALQQRLADTGE